MSPTTGTVPLDELAMRRLEKEFQPKLFNFRLQNYASVKDLATPPTAFDGLSARMRQIARALSNPMLGNEEWTSGLLNILRNSDHEAQIERSLEPEWVVGEFLLASCHADAVLVNAGQVQCISVGGMAAEINKNLACRSEDLRLTAKKTGLILKSLGLRTTRAGNWGRGLALTKGVKRRIHEIAAQFGIDRRTIASLAALNSGLGGASCALCEEFKLSGGLRFVEDNELPMMDDELNRIYGKHD